LALKYNSRAAHAAGFVDLRPGMQDDGNFGTTRLATVAMTLPTKYQQIARDAEAGRPDAQFLLSQICMQNGDTRSMMLWLRRAIDSGVPDALGALGRCYENGHGVQRDMAAALQHYERAVASGSKVAAFDNAQLLHKSRQGAVSSDEVYGLLVTAAKANVTPAFRVLGYVAMQHESTRGLAIDCLRRAADSGDSVANFMLESLDDEHAPRQAGASRDSIDFPQSLSMFPDVRPVDYQQMNDDPPIMVFKDVLDPVDRAYLMFLSEPSLSRAHVIDPDGDKSGMVSKVRTNQTTYIPFEVVDIIGRYIEMKIINATGEDLLSSEPMSILKYAPGEYYRPHLDYFDPKLAVSSTFMEDGGQRTASAVTYLTAPSKGGGTSFPNLDLTVPAAAGSTLWFRNCSADGQVDERSLHAGDTVEEGEKWVVTKWFREGPTRYLQL
jgi:TPR repeat protein